MFTKMKETVALSKWSYALSATMILLIVAASGVLLSPLAEGVAVQGWVIPSAIGIPAMLIIAAGCFFVISKENTTGSKSIGFIVVGWGLAVYATSILIALNFLVKL